MKNGSICINCIAQGKSKKWNPKQFDFERNWESMIVPLLDDPEVVQALDLGLRFYQSENYEEAPANLRGYPLSKERRAARESLWWYQSWESPHFLAPFCWALGKKLFPKLKWGFASSSSHTVAIGWSEDWEKPERVMDILEFSSWDAQDSLDVVKEEDGKFYDSLTRYFSSFYSNSEKLYQDIEATKKRHGTEPGNEGFELIEHLCGMFAINSFDTNELDSPWREVPPSWKWLAALEEDGKCEPTS